MKKVIVFAFLAAIFANTASAGTITGVVADNSNGMPIEGLWVFACDYTTDQYIGGASTNSDGFYSITGLPAGTYRVAIHTIGTDYAQQYYNNIHNWTYAWEVPVPSSGVVQNINFSLELGASISGIVKNSAGQGQPNVQVNCWADDGGGTGGQTDENGCYECAGLPACYAYNVVAYPESGSGYMIAKIMVEAYQPGEYLDNDIVLNEGGLTISGRITDKETGLPLADIRVGCWNDDVEIWTETRTDENGLYVLTNLPPGNEIEISIEPDSYYAYMGAEDMELWEDLDNLDFALSPGASICGKVIDAKTAEPLADVEIEYWCEQFGVGRNSTTDENGSFCIDQLPPGIAELKAMPDVDTGYAWNLPWGSDWICLDEGQSENSRIITLEKGALVSGSIKDAQGNPLDDVDYCWSGNNSEGWLWTDFDGSYQIRIPVGQYLITSDDDDFACAGQTITITNINDNINVSDLVFYDESTGGQISGQVNNPTGAAKADCFVVVAFKAGAVINETNWYTVYPVSEMEMDDAGTFILNKLQPGINYDIYLCAESETLDEIESLSIRDSALNVSVGTSNIILEYNSQGGTVNGIVKNADNKPILGAGLLLFDSSNRFVGFADVNEQGRYVINNVPAGSYTAKAVHSKYLTASAAFSVTDGEAVEVNSIVLPFAGSQDGADLDGDGSVDALDVAQFASQWLNTGTNDADFNNDSSANFQDWTRLAENWLMTAIWYHE